MLLPNYTVNEERRHARLELGLSERTLLYRGFLRYRSAIDIRPQYIPVDSTSLDAVHGKSVTYLGGGAYGMSPCYGALANVTTSDWADAVISVDDLNLAPNIGKVPLHKKPDDLPGIGDNPSTVPIGPHGYLRRVPTNTTWDAARLDADEAAFPPPDDPNFLIPVDRIASGNISYPPNSGFIVIFTLDRDFWGLGTFARLYFGGQTEASPGGVDAGMFCLSISGSGKLHLYEYDSILKSLGSNPWWLRQTMNWSTPGRADHSDTFIGVYPYSRETIAIIARTIEPTLPPWTGRIGALFGRVQSYITGVYRETIETGHFHIKEMTGPGIVRLDLRRTNRCPIAIVRTKFLPVAYLHDEIINTERLYPSGTPIRIQIDSYLLPGTDITAAVYDATTNTPLAQDPITGNFLTNINQTLYYVKFTFTPSSDRYSTPILKGYHFIIDPVFHDVDRDPLIAGIDTRISLTGEDEQGADHATGSVDKSDLLALAAPILQVQDRIRSAVTNFSDSGLVQSVLGEYDISQSRGKLRGSPFRSYPNPNWRDYQVRLVGMWGRLVEAQAMQLYNFAKDPDAGVDPHTRAVPPWYVSNAVRTLFLDAGIPDDEIDLPLGRGPRFWLPTSENAEEWLVQPGQPILPVIEKLIHDYLLGVIVRDSNAGSRGMWRHIRRPFQPWVHTMWSFRNQRPGGTGGYWQTHAGSWGFNTSYIAKGTFDSWPEAPVANVITVRGVRPGPVKDWLITASATHSDSINNPLSKHYVGREIRYYRPVDPGITSKEHAQWLTGLLYDEMAYRRLWAQFTAPLPLVTDPLDLLQTRLRPLRVYDQILVDGMPFLLTNVDIEVHPGRGANNQFGIYEGYFSWLY